MIKVEAMMADFDSPVPHEVQEELRRYYDGEYRKMGCTRPGNGP